MMYTTDANIVIKQIPYHDKTAHIDKMHDMNE